MNAILYKEWVKIRWIFLLFLSLIGAIVLWFYIDLRDLLNTNSKKDFIFAVLYFRNLNFFYIDIINLAFSCCIAFVSFYKERQYGRLRIYFNFPRSIAWLLSILTLTPFAFVMIVLVAEIGAIFFIASAVLPMEIAKEIVWFFILNIFFSGVVFFFTSAIVLESNLKSAIFHLFLLFIITLIYFKINPAIQFAKAYFLNANLHFYLLLALIYGIFYFLSSFSSYKKRYVR